MGASPAGWGAALENKESQVRIKDILSVVVGVCFFVFETWPHLAQTGLGFNIQPRMALNS